MPHDEPEETVVSESIGMAGCWIGLSERAGVWVYGCMGVWVGGSASEWMAILQMEAASCYVVCADCAGEGVTVLASSSEPGASLSGCTCAADTLSIASRANRNMPTEANRNTTNPTVSR